MRRQQQRVGSPNRKTIVQTGPQAYPLAAELVESLGSHWTDSATARVMQALLYLASRDEGWQILVTHKNECKRFEIKKIRNIAGYEKRNSYQEIWRAINALNEILISFGGGMEMPIVSNVYWTADRSHVDIYFSPKIIECQSGHLPRYALLDIGVIARLKTGLDVALYARAALVARMDRPVVRIRMGELRCIIGAAVDAPWGALSRLVRSSLQRVADATGGRFRLTVLVGGDERSYDRVEILVGHGSRPLPKARMLPGPRPRIYEIAAAGSLADGTTAATEPPSPSAAARAAAPPHAPKRAILEPEERARVEAIRDRVARELNASIERDKKARHQEELLRRNRDENPFDIPF